MIQNFTMWVRKHPVVAFYLLAFSITWLGWLPQAAYSRGLFRFDSPVFYILGGTGPLLAVFLVYRIVHGSIDANVIFRPFWQWRVGPGWYLVGLFGYAAMWIGALIWRGEVHPELTKMGPPSAWLPVFLISFFAAIPEQLAWRGFALSRLQSRYNALVSSLIVGLLWALWHLPLLMNSNSVMSTYPIIPYCLNVIALSIIHAWIFNNMRGSLLIVTIFHAASNTVGPFAGLEQMWIVGLVAAMIVLVYGPAHLCRSGARPAQIEVASSAPRAV